MSEKETKESKYKLTFPCELFHMTAMELVEAKLYTLQKYRVKQSEIIELENEILDTKNKLWLTTDFKAEGCTNDKMRNAFVEDELKEEKTNLKLLEFDLNKFKDDLTIINDLLKIKLNGE